jgi:ferritin-like metal-binding protein YciE
MPERLNSREDFLRYKLAASLRMERIVLEILEVGAGAAQDAGVKQLLRDHQGETHRHVTGLQTIFGLMAWDVEEQPCPAMEVYEKQLEQEVAASADALVDSVVIAAAAVVEHYELAVYGTLIACAKSVERDDVAELFARNRDDEQAALDRIRAEAARVLGAQIP